MIKPQFADFIIRVNPFENVILFLSKQIYGVFCRLSYICSLMFKVFEMKKSGMLFLLLFVAGVALSSCRAQKKACAAYSSVEVVKDDQSNS